MKILGVVEINGREEKLSVIKDGDLYKYYLGNEVIGAYSPANMRDSLIAFKENTLENELSGEIKDKITQIIEEVGKEEIVKTTDERTQDENIYEKQRGYQKTIGEDKKSVRGKETVDLNKSAKSDEIKKVNTEETLENTTADINIKQEVDMDTMVTDLDSLGEKLEKAGKIKGAEEKGGKLGIVESDEIKNLKDENGKSLEGHFSRYQAVVVTNETGKNGKRIVKPLELESDSSDGINPTKTNYQVKQNKNENIEKGDVSTRLKIEGEKTIGIENGAYGEVEVYESEGKTIGGNDIRGNESLDKQLETSNSINPLEGMDEQTQKLSQEYQDGYRSVESSVQEAKKHENSKGEPCEELKQEDMDGNPNTSTHNHIDDIVAQLMKNDEIARKLTEREVRGMVEKGWEQKKENETVEEFEKRIEDNIETDAERMHGERQ